MTAPKLFREGEWLGDYEIRGRMRSGGMATLFLAQRHGPAGVSRPVVIKVIHPHLAEDESMVRMFIDEARISSYIRHSNVVYVEKFGEHDGVYYIVMEYVDGCSLLQVVRACAARGKKLAEAIAVHIAIEVAAGLHAAHETKGEGGAPLGIVHRDVSPSNVLLTRDGRIKVIDFGIAKAHGRLGITRSGSGIKGKLSYMSPEQAWGLAIDRRADIYALGICLWELLTCRQLFRAKSDLEILELVRNPVIAPASKFHPEVSAALDEVMLRATAKDPEDRHQTALELRRDLMSAVPGAIAIPPELIGELVTQVLMLERATAPLGAASPQDGAGADSLATDALARGQIAALRSRAWRNRGLAVAGFVGACAIGLVIARAGRSEDAVDAPAPPAHAIRAVDPGAAEPPALDAGVAPGMDPLAGSPGSPSEPRSAESTPPAQAASAPPAQATNTPPAQASAVPAPAPATASAASAPPPADPSPASSAAPPPVTRAPPRRAPPTTPPSEPRRVNTIEVDGAVLADETSPRTGKPAAKPRPKPPNAVQVDGAVLAQ